MWAEKVALSVLVKVTNPNLYGRQISESGVTRFNACQICRIFENDRLVPLKYDDVFAENQILLLVGRSSEMDIAVDLIGKRSDRNVVRDTDNERQELMVTSSAFSGRTLSDVAPLRNYGVVVTRINRLGLTFVTES